MAKSHSGYGVTFRLLSNRYFERCAGSIPALLIESSSFAIVAFFFFFFWFFISIFHLFGISRYFSKGNLFFLVKTPRFGSTQLDFILKKQNKPIQLLPPQTSEN